MKFLISFQTGTQGEDDGEGSCNQFSKKRKIKKKKKPSSLLV